MKNVLFLFTILFTIGCTNDTTKHPAPSASPDSHAGHNHGESENIIKNEDGTVHVKGDPSAFLVGLWEVEYALVGSTPKTDFRYKGAWIDMKGDFTFTSGTYDEQTNQGTYTYTSEPDKIIKYSFDKPDKILPTEAKVKGYAVSLLLMGKTPPDGKKSQIKIRQTNKRPAK